MRLTQKALAEVTASDVADIVRQLAPRVEKLQARADLEKALWRSFRAWWGWDRPAARTRRGGHRRYQCRRIRCAAAYLGVSRVTVERNLHRAHPTTRVIQGLVMLPYPSWSALDIAEATAHARKRTSLWAQAQQVAHGEARKLAAQWRGQWLSKTQDGITVLQLIHGRAA